MEMAFTQFRKMLEFSVLQCKPCKIHFLHHGFKDNFENQKQPVISTLIRLSLLKEF